MSLPDIKNAELWPTKWLPTRDKAVGIFQGYHDKVSETPLSDEELTALNTILTHLEDEWHRSYRHPVMRLGVQVIRDHFMRKFDLGSVRQPLAQFRRICERTIVGGYFESNSVDPNSPELKAMAKIMSYQDVVSRRRSIDDVDFSELFNF